MTAFISFFFSYSTLTPIACRSHCRTTAADSYFVFWSQKRVKQYILVPYKTVGKEKNLSK